MLMITFYSTTSFPPHSIFTSLQIDGVYKPRCKVVSVYAAVPDHRLDSSAGPEQDRLHCFRSESLQVPQFLD